MQLVSFYSTYIAHDPRNSESVPGLVLEGGAHPGTNRSDHHPQTSIHHTDEQHHSEGKTVSTEGVEPNSVELGPCAGRRVYLHL